MHPHLGELLSRSGFGLRNFVLVVWEHQIGATEMNINRVAEFGTHHGRTFDVPTGPARAPWGREAGLPLLSAFPEGEIEGMLFARPFRIGDATVGVLLLFAQIATAQFSVPGVLHHREIHISIGAVSSAFRL